MRISKRGKNLDSLLHCKVMSSNSVLTIYLLKNYRLSMYIISFKKDLDIKFLQHEQNWLL